MKLKQVEYFLFILIFFSIFFIYTYKQNVVWKEVRYRTPVKSIVAYSLEKQFEMEMKQVKCDDRMLKPMKTVVQDDIWVEAVPNQVYLFSAYLDKRIEGHSYVRIIGMVKGDLAVTIYCQIWSQEQTFVVTATPTSMWHHEWDKNTKNITYYNPLLISCPIPDNSSPENVSITTKPCDNPTNIITINNRTSRQKEFTVCVKNMNYNNDISNRLRDWLEIHRLLGADRIELYVENVHQKTMQLLESYTKNNTGNDSFTVTYRRAPPELSGGTQSVWQKRRNHLVTYNDCFYRNIHTARYVVPVDLDEIIVPRIADTWKQLIKIIFQHNTQIKNGYASLMIQNAYYFIGNSLLSNSNFTDSSLLSNDTTDTQLSNINQNNGDYFIDDNRLLSNSNNNQNGGCNLNFDKPLFFSNLYRSDFSPPGESGKSFISTKNTLIVFNHYTLVPLLPGVSRAFFVPVKLAQMNHYKDKCSVDILPECTKYLKYKKRDTVMLKYYTKYVRNFFCV